jgi:hypothetical protein
VLGVQARSIIFNVASRCAIGLATTLLAFLASPSVTASGFTQPQGKGLVIFATSWTLAAESFDVKGVLTANARILRREATTYAEYGFTDWLTGIVQTTLSDRFVSSVIATPFATVAISDHYRGFDTSGVGLRTRIAEFGPLSFAVEGNLRLSGASNRFRLAQAGHTGIEGDIRLQAGASFNLWSWPGYANVSLGYRAHTAGPADEYRADFTFGIRPRERWLWLLQSFNSFPAGRGGAGFRPMREHKLVTSVVYDINTRWSVQSGTIATIAGKNVPRDTGAFMALWYRF